MKLSLAQTLAQLLPAAAARYGGKTALIHGGRSFSFTDLDALSNRLCTALRGLGITPGERITLHAPNCWEWIASYYANAKLGLPFCALSPLEIHEGVPRLRTASGRYGYGSRGPRPDRLRGPDRTFGKPGLN